jgi:hypothetical protein
MSRTTKELAPLARGRRASSFKFNVRVRGSGLIGRGRGELEGPIGRDMLDTVTASANAEADRRCLPLARMDSDVDAMLRNHWQCESRLGADHDSELQSPGVFSGRSRCK